jgi:hypothetical protein
MSNLPELLIRHHKKISDGIQEGWQKVKKPAEYRDAEVNSK